jgi:Fur family peroxide stress response transcriptional regulator
VIGAAARVDASPPPTSGQRSTRQLDAVYRVLCASDAHPTAEQVFGAVRAAMPAVSRGTVYRNLAKLVAAGRVRIVHVHDRCARYDARLEPHDHFLCLGCTMLLDVAAPRVGDGRSRSRIRGHRVAARVVTWLGTCRSCEAATTAKRG